MKFKEYAKIFYVHQDEHIISKVSNKTLNIPRHFLPQHPVMKPGILTISVRLDFDASCKIQRSHSLKLCLFKRPNHIKQIPGKC